MKKLFEKVKKLVPGDMLWIFGSGAASQIFGFLSSVIVVRFLDKADYGLYVGAYNKYSYFATFLGLGFATAVLQYCSERRSESQKNAIYTYALRFGSLFNIVLMLLIAALGTVVARQGKGAFLTWMCALPFVNYLFFYYRNILRTKSDNKGYALICMSNAVMLCAGNILLTRLMGTSGFILSAYIAYIVSSAVGIVLLRKRDHFYPARQETETLSRQFKIELIKYSAMCASMLFVTIILGLLDITCLDIITGDPAVLAEYKVALAIPAAMQTVTECLSTYYYPILVREYSASESGFKGMIRKCIPVYAAVSFLMSAALFVLAPFIIKTIYGAKYVSAIPVFRILCLHLFISAGVHKFMGNIIMAMKKVNISLLFAGLSGLLNIALDFALIHAMGPQGAAWATCIVTVFITALEAVYIFRRLFSGKGNSSKPDS